MNQRELPQWLNTLTPKCRNLYGDWLPQPFTRYSQKSIDSYNEYLFSSVIVVELRYSDLQPSYRTISRPSRQIRLFGVPILRAAATRSGYPVCLNAVLGHQPSFQRRRITLTMDWVVLTTIDTCATT